VAIGEYRIGWVEKEIDDYVEAKISARSGRMGELGSTGRTKKKRWDEAKVVRSAAVRGD
jgi:hypothetical protein